MHKFRDVKNQTLYKEPNILDWVGEGTQMWEILILSNADIKK